MLSNEFLATSKSTLDSQNFLAVAMTGTDEKYHSLESILKTDDGEAFVPGILGCLQFKEAGQAYEPVTPDIVFLMMGKLRGQKDILVEQLTHDPKMRADYVGKTLLLSSNDINTAVEGESLTKAKLQKEGKLDIFEYSDLITASLKYLAMKRVGVKLGYTFKQMQSSWELVERCLNNKWEGRVFLPIDYQTIDAFDLAKVEIIDREIELEAQGPTVAVINRTYATLELDYRGGSSLVRSIVDSYLRENWDRADFTPDRYPLGIKQKELLKSFALAKQHVLVSDRLVYDGINLKEVQSTDEELMLSTLDGIERMMNGFNEESVKLARIKYANLSPHDYNYLYIITRKPGERERVERRRVPRWKK